MAAGKKKRPLIFYYIIILAVILLVNYVFLPYLNQPKVTEISYDKFIQMVNDKEISKVEITSTEIKITPKDFDENNPEYFKTGPLPVEDRDLVTKLLDSGVEFASPIESNSVLLSVLLTVVLPIVLMGLLFYFFSRSMNKRMGGGVMTFGKNTSKLYAERSTGKTFDDVAGQDEAKQSLKEIVDFLHNPGKYTSIGAKLPKGALLVGPPGTGKTLLAKAVAGEAKVPFFSISGSEFVEMFVGMGASRVRDLFRQAVENAPCIVFIDEIDAIGKSRDSQFGNDEREQTLNQLLSEMDGFDSSKGVVIIAATNRPEILDKALLRPGRFDRRIVVNLPDLVGRVDILKVHIKNVIMDTNIDLKVIARATAGASGADLENIINEGALRAVRNGRNKVTQKDLEDAVEVILAGEEKKNKVLLPEEKRIVAYHEIGHALVSALLSHTEPIHKITIIPRTMGSLGYTLEMPKDEKNLVSKNEAVDRITVLAGGRAAEKLVFDSITTGASNDIEVATDIARSMITVYGMSDEFGFMSLEKQTNTYLPGAYNKNYSDETAFKIDSAVKDIVNSALDKAQLLLSENRTTLDKAAAVLIEKENITGDEFIELLRSDGINVEKSEK